jgi:hypothetical protein
LTQARQGAHSSATYWPARTYQKFSSGLKGLSARPGGNLLSFLDSSPLEKQGFHGEADEDHHRNRFLANPAGPKFRVCMVPRCAAEVEMIAMKDAGVISNLHPHALEEWLHSTELHRSQAADGSALTCLNSLLARVQKTKTS